SLSSAPVITGNFTNGQLVNFPVTFTSPGTNIQITATDNGPPPKATGTSNQFDVNPSTVNTSVTVTSSGSPSVYGEPVTFTATVTAASGSNPPLGSVNFVIDSGSPIAGTAGATTSTTATWTLTTSALSAGTHIVSASYSPTGNFNASDNTATPFSQSVDKRPATWITDANSKLYGEPDPNPLT